MGKRVRIGGDSRARAVAVVGHRPHRYVRPFR
ncbi:hypothetical protein Rrhod_2436 [Rhodococcus rhodnii LMG 5362]|uniref:Uncharacterized protein n=1 Tax=Rhodococcus rhodnii LMG 5362 TaxID=1273125 RepID=R7WLN5_9NOCA|nr:hypothetical protein Rrhod_2436 [Rhodococcus rhodnii LMG 5362]